MLSLMTFVVSIAFCILGIIFVVQGIRQKLDEHEAVPISNFSEMEELTKEYRPSMKISEEVKVEEKSESETEALQESVAEKNKDDDSVEAQKLMEKMEEKLKIQEEDFTARISELEKKKNELEEALRREVANKQVDSSDEELNNKLEEKQRLVGELEERIQQQDVEFKERIEEIEGKNRELSEALEQIKTGSEEDDSIEDLKTELSKRQQILLESRITIDNFKEENAKLKAQNIILREKVSDLSEVQGESEEKDQLTTGLENEVNNLRIQNQQMASQLNDSLRFKDEIVGLQSKEKDYVEKIRILKEEIEQIKSKIKESSSDDVGVSDKFKVEMQDLRSNVKRLEDERDQLMETLEESKKNFYDKLDQANEAIRILKEKLQNADTQQFSSEGVVPKKEAGSMFPIVELRNENERLLKDKAQLREDYNRLKELNNRIAEKERILQYELTKSQAQSLGLEKICEDFKEEIERLSSRISV